MPSDRFVLVASHGGETRDLWRLIREPRQVIEWNCEYPRYHHTMRDGEHPHFTALDGLDSPSAPVHPTLVAAVQEANPGEKAKHHPMGWPTHWTDVGDYHALTGTAFVYPDDFPRLDARPASRRWRRLVVPIEDGQGVQATHYLAWPTETTRRHVLTLCAMPGTVDVQLLAHWDPWSIIHVQVTKPGAVQGPGRPASTE
jgi:hypothetical protein